MATTSVSTEPEFPEKMAFRKSWRPYQQRLLDGLDNYLEDRRLHIVAAPGSGKTVLGLEVVRRLNQRTLVLAPTITIRDQWIQRLIDLFLTEESNEPRWVSADIHRPAQLTVVTYQALYAVCCRKEEPEPRRDDATEKGEPVEVDDDAEQHKGEIAVPDALIQARFGTVVLDEAHHLKAEWWRTLTAVVAKLEKPSIVALTATPPYDVPPSEWQRYQELCGPVDAEVSVPELVLEGDLCPHQDYVYFSTPSNSELRHIADFRKAVDLFVSKLKENRAFKEAVAAHPWMKTPDEHTEEMLEDPEYLSSMLIFLNATGEKASAPVLNILGLEKKRIPNLELEWLEKLLTRCLYSDANNFGKIEPVLKSIRHELLGIGAIERRRVTLRNPADHLKLLTTSVSKLTSVEEVVKLEASSLGAELRCVILTDFIRKAELPKSAGDECGFEDIGIVPLFEWLRRASIPGTQLGVLSGSLTVIPNSAEPLLIEIAKAQGIDGGDISISGLPHDSSYSRVELHGTYQRGIVRLMTSLFERGGITVLVGTKSLLGEGWDAPCINALILASFVGSFVLSNQMRGRSIRIDPRKPEKTANIWHLVCIEPGIFGPGEDYELLVRRCSAFVGVSAIAARIENGTERLGFGRPPFTREQIVAINAQSCHRASDRGALRKQWQEALKSGVTKQMADGLKAPEESLPRGFVLTNTIAALLTQALFAFLIVIESFGRGLGRASSGQDLWVAFEIVVSLAIIVSLPWLLLALWRLIRHGTPERSIRQIGRAILDALQYEGSIRRSESGFRVYANRNSDGTVYCWIGGGTRQEQTIFLRALGDTLSPLGNPRYLLARTRIWHLFREDYFAVPEVLARKKEFAEFFSRRWQKAVGPVQLIYTRTPEGRRILLRARTHSLTSAFQKRAERVSCWK